MRKNFIISIRHAARPLISAAALFGVSFSAAAQTSDQNFVAGVHYKVLAAPQPVQTGDHVEVAEVFWYRCPHCYNLQPYLSAWQQRAPADAELVHVPAVLNERWAFDARLYYTIAALDLVPQLHMKIFTAIHARGKTLSTSQKFADWAAREIASAAAGVDANAAGGDAKVDAAAVLAAFNSFAVAGKVQFAKVMSRKYGITGTPSIVVDGKYRTSVSIAGSVETMFAVVDFLVDKARDER